MIAGSVDRAESHHFALVSMLKFRGLSSGVDLGDESKILAG
jgi:hypothetical protein